MIRCDNLCNDWWNRQSGAQDMRIELYTSVQTSLGVHFVSSVCSFPAISTVLLPTIHEVNSYIAVHSDVMGLLMLVANGTLPHERLGLRPRYSMSPAAHYNADKENFCKLTEHYLQKL